MATTLIILGVLTGALGIADIFLNDRQKRWIDLFVLKLWNWLSDAKQRSLTGWLLKTDYQTRFQVVAVLISLAFVASHLTGEYATSPSMRRLEYPNATWLLVTLFAVLLGVWIGRRFQQVYLKGNPKTATIWAIVGYLSTTIFWISLMNFAVRHIGPTMFDVYASPYAYLVYTFLALAGLVVQIFCWVACLPLLIVSLLQALVYLAEGFVRRIAEAPKGVVVTLSGLATAIGACLKAFS